MLTTQYNSPGQPDLVLNPKKKVWDRVAQHLTVDGEGVAKYRDEPLRTQHGLIRTRTVMSGIVR